MSRFWRCPDCPIFSNSPRARGKAGKDYFEFSPGKKSDEKFWNDNKNFSADIKIKPTGEHRRRVRVVVKGFPPAPDFKDPKDVPPPPKSPGPKDPPVPPGDRWGCREIDPGKIIRGIDASS